MSNQNLEELAAEVKKNYYKDWRAKNKDRIKQTNADYWKRRAQKLAEERAAAESCVNNDK